MDYIGNKCPVCNKYFHADDDIVVCPECGTPHHRECYEQEGHCFNEKLHSEGYDFAAENQENDGNSKKCPVCGKPNDEESFFCKYCGASLSQGAAQQNADGSNQGAAPFSPFSGSQSSADNPYGMPFLDPLGGVPSDSDLGDGVTAGEAAKYVKQNTPYFIRVFSNIKNFNKSKFNFAAAIFTGGYMLYRKLYVLGSILAAIQAGLILFEIYLGLAYSSLFVEFETMALSAASSADYFGTVNQYLSSASTTDLLVLFTPSVISLVRIAIMLVSGFCFNRMYMTHCKKRICAIKEKASPDENPETILQTKGGVNTALAISLLVTAMLLTYLPRIILTFF